MPKSPYSFIESFCGPGGMSLGLTWAGFQPLLSFDNDEPSILTHQLNIEGEAIVADASVISPADILNKLRLQKGELALFAGGPPCQGFSKQQRGAHRGNDARNDLVLDYARLVKGLQPRFLLFENVAIFGQARGTAYIECISQMLDGYQLYFNFLNSADYGLAQTRQRFVIVGRRRDQKTGFEFPKPTVRKWKTVREALGGLPEPPEDCSVHPRYKNHQRARVTPINIERFSYVPEGGGWQDIPKRLRLPCHQKADVTSGGWPDVYGRLRWDAQCPTITGGFDSFTRGRYGHPKYDRPITPREAARIQGFPDKFAFVGNRGDVRSQIGNAVPPPMAKALGEAITRALKVAEERFAPELS